MSKEQGLSVIVDAYPFRTFKIIHVDDLILLAKANNQLKKIIKKYKKQAICPSAAQLEAVQVDYLTVTQKFIQAHKQIVLQGSAVDNKKLFYKIQKAYQPKAINKKAAPTLSYHLS